MANPSDKSRSAITMHDAAEQRNQEIEDVDRYITRDTQPVIPGFEINKPSADSAPEEAAHSGPKKTKINWDDHDSIAAYTCADIFVGSFTIKSFESFQLLQSIAAHHTFELVIAHDALLSKDGSPVVDDQWLANASKLMGEKISIGFYYHVWPDQKRWFEGIVTNVSYRRCTYGFGEIVISGGSPTLLLDAAPHTQSFTNKTVQSIATEILNQAGLDTKNVKSRFRNHLPYSCQYNETHYNYLARLAAGYGDWFWYDGEDLYFGKPFFKPDVKLVLGRDVYDMEASMNARHTKTEHYGYNSSFNEALRHHTFDITGVDYFGEKALTASEQMFKTPTRQVAPIRAVGDMDVTASQKSYATAKATELFNIKGRSTNPYLFPGCNVILEIRDVSTNKKTHYATLIITELRQTLSYDGSYDCEFVGIPQKTENLPFHQFTVPVAEPQLATVVANTDDKYGKANGRVKVQFPWQDEPTDFIRVMTPDAGSSDAVNKNRGHVFVPEVGDQVMVGFENGNPDKPFVLGGMFHGQNGIGGMMGNHIKSIITRSGCTVQFDDADGQGSITVKDPSGNSFYLDGKGNINLTAPKNITMTAGANLDVNVGNNMTFNVGNKALLNIMQQMLIETPVMQQLIAEYFHTQAGKALINSLDGEIKIEAKEVTAAGQNKMLLHSDEALTANSKGTVEIRGANGNKHSNEADKYETTRKILDAKCTVKFRVGSSYQGEYGFDWVRIGDTMQLGDIKYEPIVGRYKNKLQVLQQVYDIGTKRDLNPPIKLVSDSRAYQMLCRGFEMLDILFLKQANNQYYGYDVPVMTLLKGGKAVLSLKLNIIEEPSELKFICDGKKLDDERDLHFSVSTITKKTKGKRFIPDGLTIECKKEFSKSKNVEVIAITEDGSTRLAGKLTILANDKPHRYKANIVFVQVKTQLGNIMRIGQPSGRETELEKYLNQAYVTPNIVTLSLDISNDATFKQQYTALGVMRPLGTKQISPTISIHNYLLNAFIKKYPVNSHTNYEDYYKVFFINEQSGGLYGHSRDIGSLNNKVREVVVYAKGFNDSTTAHELLHAMGLLHTFDNDSRFTFEQNHTNNIMDYSDMVGIPVVASHKYQWEILHGTLDKE
ncbi:phage baseplate assembly protein V [Taibaiella soli]|uniref:Gp5/Type VI secretion system Vgr protein OB-fold domain-containing protein n=1 Tax=Taibaiella soli TaxID=1649169 RepID=A0A2W2AXK9_9BACT|nr:phage baseplate assembly protein V [Taibaiella soli]PZF72734.1 hypothetical protein DN068_12810 [Taibaiella soli]